MNKIDEFHNLYNNTESEDYKYLYQNFEREILLDDNLTCECYDIISSKLWHNINEKNINSIFNFMLKYDYINYNNFSEKIKKIVIYTKNDKYAKIINNNVKNFVTNNTKLFEYKCGGLSHYLMDKNNFTSDKFMSNDNYKNFTILKNIVKNNFNSVMQNLCEEKYYDIIIYLHNLGFPLIIEMAPIVCKNNNLSFLKYLVKNGVILKNIQYEMFGIETIIENACKYGDLKMIKFLEKTIGDIITYHYKFDMLLINKKYDIVDYLIKNGRNISQHDIYTIFSKKNDIDCLEIINFLDKKKYNFKNKKIVESASLYGHINVVRFLIEQKKINCNHEAIDSACLRKHYDVVLYLNKKKKKYSNNAIIVLNANKKFDIIRQLKNNNNKKILFMERYGYITITSIVVVIIFYFIGFFTNNTFFTNVGNIAAICCCFLGFGIYLGNILHTTYAQFE
jgi:hypothetical protein